MYLSDDCILMYALLFFVGYEMLPVSINGSSARAYTCGIVHVESNMSTVQPTSQGHMEVVRSYTFGHDSVRSEYESNTI